MCHVLLAIFILMLKNNKLETWLTYLCRCFDSDCIRSSGGYILLPSASTCTDEAFEDEQERRGC